MGKKEVSNKIHNDKSVSKKGVEAFEINFDNLDINENIMDVKIESKMFYRDAVINLLGLLNLSNNIENSLDNQLMIKYPEMTDEKIAEYEQFFNDSNNKLEEIKEKEYDKLDENSKSEYDGLKKMFDTSSFLVSVAKAFFSCTHHHVLV